MSKISCCRYTPNPLFEHTLSSNYFVMGCILISLPFLPLSLSACFPASLSLYLLHSICPSDHLHILPSDHLHILLSIHLTHPPFPSSSSSSQIRNPCCALSPPPGLCAGAGQAGGPGHGPGRHTAPRKAARTSQGELSSPRLWMAVCFPLTHTHLT